VQVPRSEGVANHTGPESCVRYRRRRRPRSVDRGFARLGIEPRNDIPDADDVQSSEGNTEIGAIASRAPIRRGRRPRHGRTFLAREPGGLAVDRRQCRRPASGRQQPKPMMNDREKSDPFVVATKPANNGGQPSAEPVERRGGAEGNAHQPSTLRTPSRGGVTAGLARIRTTAKLKKKERFTALLHHVTPALLRAAYSWLRREAAAGVDGVTWDEYGKGLDRRLADLHDRIHRGSYRAQPTQRRYIPKPDGRQRPLGIAAVEDKIVQRAVVEVLNAIYEEDFLGFSYGFRTGRGQHDALDALAVGIETRAVNWILDADIAGFFDTVNHDWLLRFVEQRTGDRRVIRLIRKWLKAGVMEDGRVMGNRGRDPARRGGLTPPGQHLPALCH
jgi:hypothetical protein